MVRSTTSSIVADVARAGALLADAPAGWLLKETGLGCVEDSDVVIADEDGFVDCCALALNRKNKEVIVTQDHIRITHPRLRISSKNLRKAAAGCSGATSSRYASLSRGSSSMVPSWLNTGAKNKFRRAQKSHKPLRVRGFTQRRNMCQNSTSTLALRNLRDVSGENDPALRRAAIDESFHSDAVSMIQRDAVSVTPKSNISQPCLQ